MLKGFVQQSSLNGKIRTSALIGTVPKSPAPVSDSDHQIITVDLYQPDTRTVDPVITNITPSARNTQVVATSWQNLDGYDENDFKGDISL
jgi:hypothetical protein